MSVKNWLWSTHVQDETRARGESIFLRFGVQYFTDAFAWIIAIVAAVVFRYDFVVSRVHWAPVLFLCLVVVILQLLLGWTFGVYRGRFTYGSFEEARAVAYTVVTIALFSSVPVVIFSGVIGVPRSAMLIAGFIAYGLMGAVRYLKRMYVTQRMRPDNAQPVLLLGAGFMGSLMVRRMLTDRESEFIPVGFLDDDRSKRNLHLMGVPVLGRFKDIVKVANATGATALIVCVARADSNLLQRVTTIADSVGLKVKVLPELDDVNDGRTTLKDVRDLSIEDLIGRHPVDTDVASIADYLSNKRILVTGAGGSIGSELSRQIAKFGPAELMMLDRDETGLQQTQLQISGHGLLDSTDVILADIRDADALTRIFQTRRPEVVFHAAALKHLPMLEQYPDEAWKTNVLGTLNVLQAAMAIDVETFVNISTDKAANPTSILGHSKRAAERLTAWAGKETGRSYLSVRFGNVLGSRGSLLPTFQALISADKPLTVTHPDATRYFMTIPEACQLVMQAGAIGSPGEVLILDMGKPVRILDIARRMIAQSGKSIEIIYTGLRDGEKLHEELTGAGEKGAHHTHALISHARVLPIDPDRLDRSEWQRRWDADEAETTVVGIERGSVERGSVEGVKR